MAFLIAVLILLLGVGSAITLLCLLTAWISHHRDEEPTKDEWKDNIQ